MKTIRAFLVAIAAALLSLSAAQAASQVKADHVALELALEKPASPGATVWVALHQSIEPGWHTYWRNPGDTGLATSIDWDLPKGVKAGAIAWPAPKRFTEGPIVDFGYEGEAVLLVPLAIARDAALAGAVAHARLFLLECQQMCIPERVTLDLPLDAAPGAAELFAQARAELPRAFAGEAEVESDAKRVTLTLTDPMLAKSDPRNVRFYPATLRAVDNDTQPVLRLAGDTLTWSAPLAARAKPYSRFEGVLEIPGAGTYFVSARDAGAAAAAQPAPAPATDSATLALLQAALFAFLGGWILNLMPCVLPVLSMKALAMAKAHESPHELHRDGAFYFLGVIATFGVIAGILLLLKAGGAALGWGFQLQYPPVVFALALLTGAIGLNLLGAFEIPLRFAGVGESLTRGAGGKGAFFTGMLAVLVASPCTAPFMGTALGFALTQPPAAAAVVFLALGTGFALPFSALTMSPRFIALVPRPGPWMLRFRELLAFPMFATAIWLLWVLGRQVGSAGMAVTLCAALGLVFLLWLAPHLTRSLRRAAVLAGGLSLIVVGFELNAEPSDAAWAPWSEAAVQQARASGKPVLVDFSAAWCVTCLVNERVALEDGAVVSRLRSDGVVTLKGDWTNRSAAISSELARFGRGGVPLYLLYPANGKGQPIVLPQILTPALVLGALDSAKAPTRVSQAE